MLHDLLALLGLARRECTLSELQAARDEAEINAQCWNIKLKHRERDLQAAATNIAKVRHA
jgi:hypothetical protein